ncbi:Peptidase S8 propeptide/proteinase inhibitor I9 [Dillenia turbinata]|uniref:Peptidase S8 propeptide/proteinase inhibitor I9 n=1 Tax=Dillenia turbinata TaxID=194707 RepID=A0AAN8Z9T8_9MAGN
MASEELNSYAALEIPAYQSKLYALLAKGFMIHEVHLEIAVAEIWSPISKACSRHSNGKFSNDVKFYLKGEVCFVYIVYLGLNRINNPILTTEFHIQLVSNVFDGQEDAKQSMLYSYKHSFSGFSAQLNSIQVTNLASNELKLLKILIPLPRPTPPMVLLICILLQYELKNFILTWHPRRNRLVTAANFRISSAI